MKILCPHCGNKTPFKKILEHNFEDDEVYQSEGEETGITWDICYEGYACSTCENIVLYVIVDDDEHQLVYPTGKFLDYRVPKEIRKCYEEASRIRKSAPNAYAVMIRKALEAICNDHKIKKGKLHYRLEGLCKKTNIPSVFAETSFILKKLGNIAVHETTLSITVSMTWSIDSFFKALVEYLYVAPSKLEEFVKMTEKFEEKLKSSKLSTSIKTSS
jgi:hypothetical protein